MTRIFGWTRILATGAPAPGATVTVYDTATLNLSTIYSDNLLTPKANPFTADANGYYFFYISTRVDVQVSGAGITTYTMGDVDPPGFFSLNALTGDTQLFAVGTAGTDFAISSAGATHTFNIPSASGANRGLVTTGAQTFAGLKTFTTPIAAGSGGTGVDGSAAANGRLLIGNGAGYTLAALTGTANQVVVANGAGSITLSLPQSIAAASSPTFTNLTLSGLTANGALVASGASVLTSVVLTDGQVLVGRTGNTPIAASLTAGANISITGGSGSISIAATGVLTSLNALTAAAQTFAVGTTGTDFNIASAGSVHTFHIPDASAANRGLVTTGSQTFAGAKTLTGAFVASSATSPSFGAVPTFTPGTGSDPATTSGVVNVNITPVGNVGVGEDNLMTYSLKGNTLNANGKGVRVTAWGSCAANGNNKTIKIYFGATLVANSTAFAASGVPWRAVMEVIRTGAATQIAKATVYIHGSVDTTATATPTETLSGAVTIKLTGEATANDDIQQVAMIVEVIG